MPDYKKMYMSLMQETEKAINLLIAAQRTCEDIYVETPEPEIMPLNRNPEDCK